MSFREKRLDSSVKKMVLQGFNTTPLTDEAQDKLNTTYLMLSSIPQDCGREESLSTRSRSEEPSTWGNKSRRNIRRSVIIFAAALIIALICCTAYAANTLLKMQSNEAVFFDGENLDVYDSLKPGVESFGADVGQVISADGVVLTLDSISSDRSIINLFFTVDQDEKLHLDEMTSYEGVQQSEWARLQNLVPRFRFSLTSNGEELGTGSTRSLDAYRDGDSFKCLIRIVSPSVLPDEANLVLTNGTISALEQKNPEKSYAVLNTFHYEVGLDLTDIKQPHDLGARDITFQTSEGEKTMGIKRFTISELGTVLEIRNDLVYDETYGFSMPDDAIDPYLLKFIDGEGNVLTYIESGDGLAVDYFKDYTLELSKVSGVEKGVTIVPILSDLEAMKEAVYSDNTKGYFDVSKTGTLMQTSEYGGYELTGWEIQDNVVSIRTKPYGWVMQNSIFELIPTDTPSLHYVDTLVPETGEMKSAGRSALGYVKQDYETGELVQIDSYYAASEEELKTLTEYTYSLCFGVYKEESEAAITLLFSNTNR